MVLNLDTSEVVVGMFRIVVIEKEGEGQSLHSCCHSAS